jgi:hypothetical protein
MIKKFKLSMAHGHVQHITYPGEVLSVGWQEPNKEAVIWIDDKELTFGHSRAFMTIYTGHKSPVGARFCGTVQGVDEGQPLVMHIFEVTS